MRPSSDAQLPSTLVYLGKSPLVPLLKSCGRPHAAIAFCPTLWKVLLRMLTLRVYPERKRAFESRRVNVHPATVSCSAPSTITAPIRSSAQSPPDGLPRGSKNVGRLSVIVSPSNETPVTGAECVPRSSIRLDSVGTTADDRGADVLLGRKKSSRVSRS